MALPRKHTRSNPSTTGNALRRLMSMADWPFEEFPDEALFSESWAPAVDLKENKKGYVVHADIPGVEPKDIDVTLDKGILTIRGSRTEESRDEGDNFHRIERFSGSFSRQFSLPDAADDGVEAKMKDGVLEIHIPKSEKAVARKIEIKG
ncbi:Hsp20/alpha crystallin family protein [Wenzhouxiangella sp. XN201]|uniref:Hsp20/alpha crystallin family protein n=1 Tax=Wenzhouxiangella sp. XN201 TaxID=2710755 RepID=UPI0013C87E6C|nr:Hsp20/alpha crystallin family protein [Wenzhouxiangella sp. XN201]NEZ03955.1 Hsp20/alpha crystallin family protein [Wenzhouxiangella sp. XN201]